MAGTKGFAIGSEYDDPYGSVLGNRIQLSLEDAQHFLGQGIEFLASIERELDDTAVAFMQHIRGIRVACFLRHDVSHPMIFNPIRLRIELLVALPARVAADNWPGARPG